MTVAYLLEMPTLKTTLLPQKSISVVTSFVFSSCDFVDRSVCPEKQGRSTKPHEPTRTKILPSRARRGLEANPYTTSIGVQGLKHRSHFQYGCAAMPASRHGPAQHGPREYLRLPRYLAPSCQSPANPKHPLAHVSMLPNNPSANLPAHVVYAVQ